MKYRKNGEKGVTMVALVITVIILLILTSMLIYDAQDNIYIKSLTNLYNDIDMLREKVSIYYNEYGKIPAKIQYTNTSRLSDSGILSANNDTGDFYVIDLEAMQGISLNYGKDYENVKNDEENADNYTDIYIINENSHNIFYVQGIEIKENSIAKMYYTDYTEPDETLIDLRYIDGILIPDGYYYIGKVTDNDENESIVISNVQGETIDTSNENQYVWTEQDSEIEEIPSDITLDSSQEEYQFIKSVKTYNGYFKNTNGNVQFIVIDEEKWSETYTKETEYTDKNGDTVTIPEGFKVSMSPTMNTVENGLVVKDSNANEWVWVEVPSSVFKTATNNEDYDNIKADLVKYAEDYRNGSSTQELDWDDEWYDGCGIEDSETYTEMYNQMLSSVYTNKGFWISRYEIGDNTATASNNTRTSSSGTSGEAVSQSNQISYNYVTCSEAQELSSKLATSGKTSSLLFGIQWDLTCKFLEENSSLKYENIATDSTDWGNYANNNAELLATGEVEQTRILNIYDFAGNVWEWTLGYATSDSSYPCVSRGGSYIGDGSDYPASTFSYSASSSTYNNVGFRVTLY